MYLHVKPNDGRYWRIKYRFGGMKKLLALAEHPYVSLTLARDRREEARRVLEDGKDPSAQRQEQKESRTRSFEFIAKDGSNCSESGSRRRLS